MTTSRSDAWPPVRLGVALAALGTAGPLAAQEVVLPSGHTARLFDVVLEADAGTFAPDAGSDPEAAPDEDAMPMEPLDAAPGDMTTHAASSGGVARFRFVVADLGSIGWEAVAADFGWLCEELALPALAANAWSPAEVVITLADREVPFGATDPEATQFFEGFRVAEGTCVALAF